MPQPDVDLVVTGAGGVQRMRSRVWVVIDSLMLLIVVSLQAWRLTGVVLHEWLATALIVGIVAHLLLHWNWVESRSKRVLRPRTGRARVNLTLNLTLFLAMATAMISGFVISKVLFPTQLTPMEYLKWHGIHDASSRVALLVAGLHLGLNWDVMTIALRNFTRRRDKTRDVTRSAPRPARPWIMARAILIIIAATAVVVLALRGMEPLLPEKTVTFIGPDGKRTEHVPPPPDIARLRADEISPSTRGLPPALLQAVLVSLAAVAGRKVLRLRLE